MSRRLTRKITAISQRTCQAAPVSLEGLLKAASYGYGAVTALRNRLYRSGYLVSRKLPCPVICVGNITAGGTGKTPMTIYLADLLTRLGRKPVVISRGYKGSLKTNASVVGNGKDLFLTAEQAGDEPYMMARLKRFPVVVGKNRYQAGLLALDHLAPDTVVLDDGFQHIQLKRDIDLLLMDHDHPLGNGRILPAGRLREPAAPALARAHAVILTRCPELLPDKPHLISGLVPHLPIFYTRHQPFPAAFFSAENRHRDQENPGLGVFKNRSVVLFSGIADNQSFYKTITDLGATIAAHLAFDDHHHYTQSDIHQIQDLARSVPAQLLVTTEKDWGKLDPHIKWPMDLAVVGVTIAFEKEKQFQSFVRKHLDI
ncbi:MAG: tetraacyldisaccharide 4'-kinase [Desulfotignum sp.]